MKSAEEKSSWECYVCGFVADDESEIEEHYEESLLDPEAIYEKRRFTLVN